MRCVDVFSEDKNACLKPLWLPLGSGKNSLYIHERIQQNSNRMRRSEGKIECIMYKYYAFYVTIHVSGIAPCVNPSENSSRTLMKSTFDKVGSLIKTILMVTLIIT